MALRKLVKVKYYNDDDVVQHFISICKRKQGKLSDIEVIGILCDILCKFCVRRECQRL